MSVRPLLPLLIVVCIPMLARAAGTVLEGKKLTPPNPLTLLAPGTPDALAGNLRGYLAHTLPRTLYEGTSNWGHTTPTVRGVKWKGQGLGVHPQFIRIEKNDGHWRRTTVTADNLSDSLIVDLRDLRQTEAGVLNFTLFVSFDVRGEYTQQNWNAGAKLYDGSVRARMRLKLTLNCTATARFESNGTLLPDAIFRMFVTKADFRYDNFVVEHVAGVGGEAAKLFGDIVKGGLTQWHPGLERDLIAKANQAIVASADTREVRISLLSLFKAKK